MAPLQSYGFVFNTSRHRTINCVSHTDFILSPGCTSPHTVVGSVFASSDRALSFANGGPSLTICQPRGLFDSEFEGGNDYNVLVGLSGG